LDGRLIRDSKNSKIMAGKQTAVDIDREETGEEQMIIAEEH